MKEVISWLNEALAGKDLVMGMTYYRVQGGEIRATDGRITASHPWQWGGEFLVPGNEFEKILKRMPDEPTIEVLPDGRIKLKAERFHGTINTLPLASWEHPGVEDASWRPLPPKLPRILKALRPFISDNAVQPWAMCVALENGWAYSTNNVAIAGAPCEGLEGIQALLPSWALDFILERLDGLSQWAWAPHFVAFRWQNEAWMRSQLAVGAFPEKAAALVRASHLERPSQEIGLDFRRAFLGVAELSDDTVAVYADRIESTFGKARVVGVARCEVPQGSDHSLWGAKFLLPALEAADHWSPSAWPKPAVFKGSIVSGYVVGRRQ